MGRGGEGKSMRELLKLQKGVPDLHGDGRVPLCGVLRRTTVIYKHLYSDEEYIKIV